MVFFCPSILFILTHVHRTGCTPTVNSLCEGRGKRKHKENKENTHAQNPLLPYARHTAGLAERLYLPGPGSRLADNRGFQPACHGSISCLHSYGTMSHRRDN